jgi:hypothetical protein
MTFEFEQRPQQNDHTVRGTDKLIGRSGYSNLKPE